MLLSIPVRRSILLAAVLTLGLSGQFLAAQQTPVDVSALGPQVGRPVPEFRLPDQAGRIWTRESIMGPRGAMLVFFRSADW
jgi:hypothetical protein